MMEFEDSARLIMPEREYQRIESLVVEMYRDLDIRDVNFDVFNVARRIGCELIPFSHLQASKRNWLTEEGYDAVNYFDKRQSCYFVYYDDSKSYVRQRFSIMHEVGHIILGHKQESPLARIQANYFAGYALAPNPLIHTYGIDNFVDLSNTFNISEECAMRCIARYNNWVQYGKPDYLPYEINLLELFA